VAEIVYHPNAHLENVGGIDLVHALLLHDVAYLVLAAPVPGVAPIALSASEPGDDEGVQLVGYGAGANGGKVRKGANGRVVLNVQLGSDTIVEIRPLKGAAICHQDGDEGHPALAVDAHGTPALLGIYVGSVTGSFSNCRRYLQYLNGYEATFGYLDFYREGIKRGQARLL
jgi:hypothetical protein